MLEQPMIEKLLSMRLRGMADALKAQEQDSGVRELSFVERLSLLVEQQWNWRENQVLARRLKSAKLRHNACIEDIDYRAAGGLEKTVIRGLAKDSQWVQNHENLFVLGPTGVGKSYIACALAQESCRDGYSAFYTWAAALFRDLALARADGSFRNLLARLSRIDVLVIDDWTMAPLSEPERRDFWEICEDRYQVRSLILTSQLPVTRWHEQIGDPTVADASLIDSFTMPTASKCAAIRCVRIVGSRMHNGQANKKKSSRAHRRNRRIGGVSAPAFMLYVREAMSAPRSKQSNDAENQKPGRKAVRDDHLLKGGERKQCQSKSVEHRRRYGPLTYESGR